MPDVLFANTQFKNCGVHQYGIRLFDCLKDSSKFRFLYYSPINADEVRALAVVHSPDFILYNWQNGMPGWMGEAPLTGLGCKQILIHHDGHNPGWDAIVFSDPTGKDSGIWHHIGRPIPQWLNPGPSNNPIPTIGVSGFLGGRCREALSLVMRDFQSVLVRMHLPYSIGDGDGWGVREMAQTCLELVKTKPGISLDILHDFIPQSEDLIRWLSMNDLNLYVRETRPWVGISSGVDLALAAGRPIALNRSPAFRHLFHATPSIFTEDKSLPEIIQNGMEPIKPFRQMWQPERIREQVEDVLLKIT